MNRGPAAAAENRAALIVAAREIFAEQGVDAPLSAIAKRAGVGQGSLYRHFPTRGAIAGAAFDANVADIERIVAEGATLAQVLRMVEEQATSSPALIEATLPAGRVAGTVPEHFTADDVMLCVRLVASALTESSLDERGPLVHRAWQLLGVRLD